MVQIRSADADRFVTKPDPNVRVVLIYGADEGVVSERAERLARTIAGDDPLSRIHLEMEALSADEGRLADEAGAMSLFGGGRRAITLRVAGNRDLVPAIEAVLDAPPNDNIVILTAGDLRKTSPLLKLESRAAFATIRCFADSERDLDRIIDEEMKSAGLKIDADAKFALRGLLGADRRMSRAEVAKLALYAAGRGTVTLADVRAASGDVAAFEVDEVVDAITAGDGAAVDRGYARLLADGTANYQVVSGAFRHFNYLEVCRAAFDEGAPARAIVERGRPPMYGPRGARVAAAIERWPLPRIRRAQSILDDALFDSRLNGAIADDVVGQALLMTAALAPKRG